MDSAATIDQAVDALRIGELVGVPTDTLYGIAGDPFHEDTLDRMFELKSRPGDKPLSLLVSSMDQAMSLASFTDQALDLADRYWPGGLTLVLAKLERTPDWIGDGTRRTVGLRCPDHPVALELLEQAGPLVVTSANRSGQPAALDSEQARAVFGEDVSVYLPGAAPGGEASTIIDLTQPRPLILRRGPVVPIDDPGL